MNINKLHKNQRAMKALTGMSSQEFNDLLPDFARELHLYAANKPNRKRAPGGGQTGILKTPAAKLFFILFYLKTYPTFDVLAFLSGKSRNRSWEAANLYLMLLEKALGKKIVLPERKINSVEEFLEKFPEVKDVFVDGTERRMQRPKETQTEQTLLFRQEERTHT